jgi:hypothetical protein
MKTKTLVLGGAIVAAVGMAAALGAHFLSTGGEPEARGGPTTMRLISGEQYRNTIAYVFGEDIKIDANFPELQRREGLVSLGSTTAEMTPGALEQFDRAARSISLQIVDANHRATLVPCEPAASSKADADCAGKFFTQVGRYLYRRPLTPSELASAVTMAGKAADARGDFYAGLAFSLAGLMTSPKFLYIAESTEADPDRDGKLRLDAYSKASRLSLFLWNALPDDALLIAAAAGELHTREGLNRQVERMIASPRLELGVRGFFVDLLQFQDFESLVKDAVIYPTFTFEASQEVNEQVLRLVTDHLLTRQGDYRELFTTNHTFVNRALGPLYQTSVPIASSDDWVPYELDPKQSAGVLTSLSFLAAHSHPGRSSPTRRGKAIREIFLCQRVPDPPPTVNFSTFENLTGKLTARDRLVAHSTDAACAGCHKLTDPVGLGFENFDGAGQFRSEENKIALDTSGDFDGRKFTGVADVGKALHDHPALIPCLTSRLYSYGVGREARGEDRPWLSWLATEFASQDFRLPALLKDIAVSNAFFSVTKQASEPPARVADAAK